MGDSDDEYDRRRARDKFRRERSDYQERRDDRNRRDDFPERESWSGRERSGRRDYRDYDPRGRRERYSSPPRHELSPPMKRMRRDWDDRGSGYGEYDMPYGGGGGGGRGGMMGGGPPGNWGGGGGMPQDMAMMHNPHTDIEPGLTQPLMMTFKHFLASQDDSIDDQEAVKKYNEYKIDFKRQQVNEFFLNHKEEEWFKSKYHPEECEKRQAEQRAALRKRMETYVSLLEKGWIDAVSIDVEKADQIVRLLDAVVIKLEGGTDNDLKFLDDPYEEEKPKEPEPFLVCVKDDIKKDIEKGDAPKGKEDLHQETTDATDEQDDTRRKRSREYQDGDSSSESDSNAEEAEEGDEPPADQNETKRKKGRKKSIREDDDGAKENGGGNDDRTAEANDRAASPVDDSRRVSKKKKAKKEKLTEDTREEGEGNEDDEDEEEGNEEEGDDEVEEEEEEESEIKKEEEEGTDETKEEPRPRPLHRTCSIFLRNLAPTITKAEVEAMCKRYSGFLRVAIADPQPERRFFRRGWVTFERTVNIKEICWNLNNIRLRECELGAIVNRDLSRRIRSVNGIASHKQVVRTDIKQSARIIQNLDNTRGLWLDDSHKDDPEDLGYELCSKNPLLKNITDYLIEEASAEEEELMGTTSSEENKEGEDASCATLEKDETLLKVLDRLLLYLRVVHSVDYYNHSEYPNEDEMPNRCGIMHARGSPPTSKVNQQEINEYLNHFEQKISTFIKPQTRLEDAEANKLGKKNPEAEVEKFIQANTQELAKDKWLCPLSGKKFKGPEFVRKHIHNKHGEKVDEVKREVEYFNNYLLDSKRPQLPEHPANRQNVGPAGRGDMHMGGPGYHGFQPPHFAGFPPRGHGPPSFQGGYGGRNYPDHFMRSGNFGKRNFGRPASDPRGLISYRDLDAPHEMNQTSARDSSK